MIDRVEQNRPQIQAICRKYGVRKLEIFGSAARGDFAPSTSDIDLFFEFSNENQQGLADRYFGLQEDLERLLGCPVDLVSALDATNPYFLQVANQNREVLYAA